MANLTLTNLTTNNVSITGDKGEPRISLSAAVGANTYTLNAQLCLGNVLLCDALSALITSLTISVVDAASNTLTAANIESYKSGTYWDTDDDAILDYSEGGVIHATTLKAVPVGADEIRIEDSAATWAVKRATVTSIATAVAVISPPGQARVVVTGISPETITNEQSTVMTNGAANEFVPTHAIVHMEDVGVGAAAAGDFDLTIGTASAGTQILAATACTGVIGLNTKLVIPLDVAQPAIAGDETIFVRVDAADSTAGAAHLVDVYLIGQTFVSGV